jgi:hypothetical protein
MSPRKNGFLDRSKNRSGRMRDLLIEMFPAPDDHPLSFVPYVGDYLLLPSDAVDIIRELQAYDPPNTSVFVQMLRKYSPEIVHDSVLVTAKREADGMFRRVDDAIPYLWGVAKRISSRLEEQGGEL